MGREFLQKVLVGFSINLILVLGFIFIFTEPSNKKLVEMLGRDEYQQSISYLKEIVKEKPSPIYMNHLAWLLTTVPESQLRNYPEAIVLSQAALNRANQSIFKSRFVEPFADTLACAHFGNNNFERANEIASQYELKSRIDQFSKGTQCRDPIYPEVQRALSSVPER